MSEDAKAKAVESQLKYVEEVSKNARTTWFGLIALMLFCGVTLLDVQDRDFFEYGASTQLPLINVSVPTINFFWAAPLLVTGLYTYLHLYLDKLWRALARLDKDIDDKPVTEVVYPWLISDTALEMRPKIKRRPYWLITRGVTFCLCWLIGPVIMGLFWWYSWAPHDERLTSLIGVQLVWLSFVGGSSWIAMHRRALNPEPETIPGMWFLGVSVFLPVLCIVAAYGWAKTEDGRWWAPPGKQDAETAYLYSADLYRANFVKPDKDWKGRDAAWREYRRKNRKDVIADLKRERELNIREQELYNGAGNYSNSVRIEPKEKHIQMRLKYEFDSIRIEARERLERRNYSGADLRNANLRESFLAGVNLAGANLDGANLERARLEGATLEGASLKGASLVLARLEGARMQGANFESAGLSFANFADADVKFASVISAGIGYARNLKRPQLEQMYGDASIPKTFSVLHRVRDSWSIVHLERAYYWPMDEIPKAQRTACWIKWALSKGADRKLFPPTNVKCTVHVDSK